MQMETTSRPRKIHWVFVRATCSSRDDLAMSALKLTTGGLAGRGELACVCFADPVRYLSYGRKCRLAAKSYQFPNLVPTRLPRCSRVRSASGHVESSHLGVDTTRGSGPSGHQPDSGQGGCRRKPRMAHLGRPNRLTLSAHRVNPPPFSKTDPGCSSAGTPAQQLSWRYHV